MEIFTTTKMLLFLMLALILDSRHCQEVKNTFLTDNNWNDWVLRNVTESFQGPVTDRRDLSFESISDKSKIFHLNSSLSFSLQSPYEMKISIIELGYSIYTHRITKNDSNTWFHYTLLTKNSEICLFENYNFITTIPVNNSIPVRVETTEMSNWKIHQYLIRTAEHISKEPTICIFSENSYLTLYAYLCPHCYLEVHLSGNRKHVLNAKKSNFPQLWKPRTLGIITPVNITLIRGTTNGRYDGYWGIDIRAHEEGKIDSSENDSFSSNTCNCEHLKNSEQKCQVDCKNASSVEFTHYGFKNFTLAVYWNLTKNCNIKQFIVRLENETYKTTNFSYFFENLDACTNYTIGVTVENHNNSIGEQVNKTIETKIDVASEFFEDKTFFFDKTKNTYKRISPCLNDILKRSGEFGQNKLYSFLDLPWSDCTNSDNSGDNSRIQSTKNKTIIYMITALQRKSFELASISLTETSVNLKFKLGSSSKLIVACKSYESTNLSSQSGKNLTAKRLSWNNLTRIFEGKPPDYAFEIVRNATDVDVHQFTFPSIDHNNFYKIIVKVHSNQSCPNETHRETVTVTHKLVSTNLTNLKVCYCGQRTGFPNLTDCFETNKTFSNLFLQPLRKYSINVTIQASNFTSPSISLPPLETNSGVPVLKEKLSWLTINGTTANFTFSKNSFHEVNGEIVAYALILFTKNVKRKTDYGCWDGSDKTWPSIPENSTQLTSNFWNPFIGASSTRNQNSSFIIGSGAANDSNPPLEVNKNYWLVVRAFTNARYKDSPFLHFRIEHVETKVGKNQLLYVAFASTGCVLLSVIFFVCFYLKRTKSRRPKIDETVLLKHKLDKSEGMKFEAEAPLLLCNLEMFSAMDVTKFDHFLTDEFCNKIKQEFDIFEVKKTQSITIALQAFNIDKNRKREEYLPYDCNRVILKNLPGVGEGDYINASYIDGYNRSKAYIAAQGPKFKTVKSFWRMIWQENIEIIIMTSNTFENKERMCAEYWPPKENAIYECGRMIIISLSQNIFDCYTRRQLQVSYGGTKRLITQFQIKWVFDSERYFPNHLLPAIKFLQKNNQMCSPILVHSGYGVGRTGVIILCNLALQMIKDKGKVDFYNLTQNLKQQRLFMVKELEHYALAHFTVKECLMDQENPFNDSDDKQRLKHQLEYVDVLCEHDTMLQKLIPKAESKGEPSLVVSALRYGCDGEYFVSQEPTMEKFAPFWVMVAHESIEVITFLNKRVPFQSHLYRGAKEVIELTCVKTSRTSYCSVLKFSLLIYDAVTKEIIVERNVYVLEFTEWKQKKLVPSSIEHFVSLVDGVTKIVPPRPTLILCSDGCTASGLFVVASYVIEQFKFEAEIDACSAVRVARRSGRKFVDSEKQLKFVYKCVNEFCKSIDNYQTLDFI